MALLKSLNLNQWPHGKRELGTNFIAFFWNGQQYSKHAWFLLHRSKHAETLARLFNTRMDYSFACIYTCLYTHTQACTQLANFSKCPSERIFFSPISYLVRYHSTYLGLNSDLWRALQVLLWCTVKKLSCADSVAFNNSGSVPSEPSNPFKEIIHPGTHKTPDSVDLNATESS